MSRKFAIRNGYSTQSSTSTAKAVANATPVTHAFAQVIMDKYSPDAAEDTNEIQALFDKWPNDATTTRLAELTEVLTGYKPLVDNTAKIGSLFKVNGVIYATFFVQNGYAYGVGVSGKPNTIHSIYYLSGAPKNSGVTRSEAGLFAKELLSAEGSDLLSTVATYGSPAVSAFLKAIGTDVV